MVRCQFALLLRTLLRRAFVSGASRSDLPHVPFVHADARIGILDKDTSASHVVMFLFPTLVLFVAQDAFLGIC